MRLKKIVDGLNLSMRRLKTLKFCNLWMQFVIVRFRLQRTFDAKEGRRYVRCGNCTDWLLSLRVGDKITVKFMNFPSFAIFAVFQLAFLFRLWQKSLRNFVFHPVRWIGNTQLRYRFYLLVPILLVIHSFHFWTNYCELYFLFFLNFKAGNWLDKLTFDLKIKKKSKNIFNLRSTYCV